MKRIKWLLLATLGLVLCWWFNTCTLKTDRVVIESEKIKDTVTIVQLTDLHGASFGFNNSRLKDRIRKEEADLIVVTGDMYTAGDEKGRDKALSLLTELAQDVPVFLVNGEHDADSDYLEQCRQAGVHVMDYKTETLQVGKTTLRLYGITNQYYSPTFDLTNEFTLDQEAYSILLAHIPNLPKFACFGEDLALCGDTHGGQIRLPFIGGLYHDGSWFPELISGTQEEPVCVKGLYEMENTKMFISSGLGNYPLPIRFWNRPEVAVITLQPMENN